MAGEKHYDTALRLYYPELVSDLGRLPSWCNLPADVQGAIAGELRTQMGHPKPFGLSMLAIGNEENLPDDQAVLAAYRDHFGIDLNSVPEPAARHDLVS